MRAVWGEPAGQFVEQQSSEIARDRAQNPPLPATAGNMKNTASSHAALRMRQMLFELTLSDKTAACSLIVMLLRKALLKSGKESSFHALINTLLE